MFGKKEKEEKPSVPVYTVHTVPEPYEVIQTIHVQSTEISSPSHEKLLEQLGKEGASIGADAVIGMMYHSFRTSPKLHIFGTAIRYKTKE